ncbi:hypothetical protein MTR67_051680 [Solanum verrucosum]|uniref:Uncharacterized protein n=1 Tax=Solanum verrucosum TaxID=315347 RepID=A0AAF1A2N4_SOLVR|nr:hypothetical protein MTR67_051680 [Solanum verrucosum]
MVFVVGLPKTLGRDGEYIIKLNLIALDKDLSYEEESVTVLGRNVRKLRTTKIISTKAIKVDIASPLDASPKHRFSHRVSLVHGLACWNFGKLKVHSVTRRVALVKHLDANHRKKVLI